MKTIRSLIMISAAIAAVSCAKEINPEATTESTSLQPMTFSAVSEDGIQSKAALEGKKIVWTSGDAISVFDGSGNRKFETADNGASVTFAGEADANASGFYALYPYQEGATFHKEETQLNSSVTTANYISATVPSVQTATAGSFDPKAFFAAAKPDESGSFYFQNLLGLIQFRLADAANVVSVTLSGHNSESLTGDMHIYFNDKGNATNTYGAKTGKTVTLKGEFTADTDYYFTVRACSFEKGMTLSVEYKNGETITRKYISSSKRPTDKDGNNVTLSASTLMKLGTISNLKEGTPNDLYIAYEHGYDLTFGDQVINKATFGEATLIKAKASIATDNVHFIDPSTTEASLSNPATGEEGKVIVIGRYNGQRSILNRKSSHYLRGTSNADDLFLLANLNYISECTTTYLFNNNNKVTHEKVIFDNCKLQMTADKEFIRSTATNLIDNIQFINCDIYTTGAGSHILAAINQNASASNIVIRNNIFWNPTPTEATTKFYLVQATKTPKITKLVLDGNTFVHTYTNGNGYVYVTDGVSISDLTVTNNLFYLPNLASGNYNIVDISQTTATQLYKHNACAIADGSTGGIQVAPALPDGSEQVYKRKGLNPFDKASGGTEDYENGIFIPVAVDNGTSSFDYSTYGAKR